MVSPSRPSTEARSTAASRDGCPGLGDGGCGAAGHAAAMIPYDRPIKEEEADEGPLAGMGGSRDRGGRGRGRDRSRWPTPARRSPRSEKQAAPRQAADRRGTRSAGHRGRRPGQPPAPRPRRRRRPRRGLAADAVVHEPAWPGGADVENLALAQANAELDRAELRRRAVDDVGAGRGRPVRAHRAARRRRPRRPPGLVAGRGGWPAGPPPRRHRLPRLLVADGPPPRAVRRRLRADQRGGGRLPAPAAAEPAGGGDGAGAGRPRRRAARRRDGRADALRRLRDRPLVPAGRRRRRPLQAAAAGRSFEARMLEPGESLEVAAAGSASPEAAARS